MASGAKMFKSGTKTGRETAFILFSCMFPVFLFIRRSCGLDGRTDLIHPRGKPVGVGEGQTPAPLRRG